MKEFNIEENSKDELNHKKYDNPFKSDVFNNPGYTFEESEKRVSDKIKRIKNLS